MTQLASVSLSLTPTPLHRLEMLSKKHGRDLWIKRDDLTGFAFGGNKTRKLDLLMADATARGADTLIAVGSTQSNFCRIAAGYGSRYHMDVHLVVGPKPKISNGNLRISQLLGATVHHYDSHDWDWLEEESLRLAETLRQQGKNVYTLPVGGSTPLGSAGYISCMKEIVAYEKEHNMQFSRLIVTSGSGGTHAGLLVGKGMTGWPGTITGITISRPLEEQRPIVTRLMHETAALTQVTVNDDWVVIDDRFVGPGYGQKTEAAESAVVQFAQTEGVMLDSYYTGKAAAALLEYCTDGTITPGEHVLFLHTGGNIQLFE